MRELLAAVRLRLKGRVPDHLYEANVLVSHFTGVDIGQLLISEMVATSEVRVKLNLAVERRLDGYPLQYIIGEWEFYGLPFYVGEGVLIPRADTEVLVEMCIDFAGNRPLKILDICSGSGCIAVALKYKLPQCEVFAIEKSEDALQYLCKNVERNNVDITVIQGDALADDFADFGRFDIIISNPPYLSASDMQSLQREVSFEPSLALFGEADGLHFYRTLTSKWKDRLNYGGMLGYEVGFDQHEQVEQIFLQNGFKTVCKRRDLCDIMRVVYGFYAQ